MGYTSNGVVIPGTPIAIDFWQVTQNPRAKIFFLTHCHADHLVGLTRTWRHPIYTTSFNACWLAEKRKIASDLFITLNAGCSLEVPLDAAGAHKVLVTAIDAYHVPGAVMFLFQGYFGTVLYTGDFRHYPTLGTQPGLANLEEGEVDVLYLDNTYCHPRHSFPDRDAASLSILNIIRCHPHHHVKVGCRDLGREELFVFLGLALQELLLVPPDTLLSLQLLRAYDVFTTDPAKARIHLVPMSQISQKNHERWNAASPTISIRPSAMAVGLQGEGQEAHPLRCCSTHPCCLNALHKTNSAAQKHETPLRPSAKRSSSTLANDPVLPRKKVKIYGEKGCGIWPGNCRNMFYAEVTNSGRENRTELDRDGVGESSDMRGNSDAESRWDMMQLNLGSYEMRAGESAREECMRESSLITKSSSTEGRGGMKEAVHSDCLDLCCKQVVIKDSLEEDEPNTVALDAGSEGSGEAKDVLKRTTARRNGSTKEKERTRTLGGGDRAASLVGPVRDLKWGEGVGTGASKTRVPSVPQSSGVRSALKVRPVISRRSLVSQCSLIRGRFTIDQCSPINERSQIEERFPVIKRCTISKREAMMGSSSPMMTAQCLSRTNEHFRPVIDVQFRTRSGKDPVELNQRSSSGKPQSSYDGGPQTAELLKFDEFRRTEGSHEVASGEAPELRVRRCSLYSGQGHGDISPRGIIVNTIESCRKPVKKPASPQLMLPSGDSPGENSRKSSRDHKTIVELFPSERGAETMLSQLSPIKIIDSLSHAEEEGEERPPLDFQFCSTQEEGSGEVVADQNESYRVPNIPPASQREAEDSTLDSQVLSLPSSCKDQNMSDFPEMVAEQRESAAKESFVEDTSLSCKNATPKCLCSQIEEYENPSVPGMFIVPYSVHCDFEELRMTVSLVKPRAVLPVVHSCTWKVPDAETYSDMSCFDDLLSTRDSCSELAWQEFSKAVDHETKSARGERRISDTNSHSELARLSERTPHFHIPVEVWSSMHSSAPPDQSWPRVRRKTNIIRKIKVDKSRSRKGVHFEDLL